MTTEIRPFPSDRADRPAYYAWLKRAIARLVKAGHLKRERYRTVVSLTDEGKAFIEAIQASGYVSPLVSCLEELQIAAAWHATFEKARSTGHCPASAVAVADERFPLDVIQ